jgi:hypothetical protein
MDVFTQLFFGKQKQLTGRRVTNPPVVDGAASKSSESICMWKMNVLIAKTGHVLRRRLEVSRDNIPRVIKRKQKQQIGSGVRS